MSRLDTNQELPVLKEVLPEREPALFGKILECGQSGLEPTTLPDDIRAEVVTALGDEFCASFGTSNRAPNQRQLLLEDMIGRLYLGPV